MLLDTMRIFFFWGARDSPEDGKEAGPDRAVSCETFPGRVGGGGGLGPRP